MSGLAALTAVASVAAIFLGSAVGVPVFEIYFRYALWIVLAAILLTIISTVPLTLFAAAKRVRSPLGACRKFIGERMGTFDGAVGTLGPILLTPALMGAFGTFKQIMPLVVPFAWDDTFAEMGRLLFLGHRPWEITHALFGSPEATFTLNLFYAMCVPLLFASVLGISLFAPRYLRARFFVTFFASCLLLGVVAAFIFASAGPCFAQAIGADSGADFVPLVHRLRAMDAAGYAIGAVHWQDDLWNAYAHHRYGFALGISAMPSMHSAIAFLYVLCAGRAAPLVRLSIGLFAVAILIGSVHLGWHYVVDGLFAWVGTWAIWRGAGVYLRWCGYAPVTAPAAEDVPEASAA